MGVLDTLGNASPARRTVKIVLDEALEAEWLDLQAKLATAADEDVKTGSLAMPATTKIVDRMEELRDAVAASEVTFAFERLDWLARVNMQAEHPPRQGNALDAAKGYNVETFTPAIIRETCASVTDGSGDTTTEIPDSLWDRLLVGNPEEKAKPLLGYSQVDRLFRAANWVNDQGARVPTSARSLLETKDSGASLAQPGPGTSPRSGSTGGSRRTSRRTSTTKKAASSAP